MARIKTYASDLDLNIDDKLLGTDADDANKTKNYSLGELRNFFGGGDLKLADVTLTPEMMVSLNGGNSLEVLPAPGEGKMIFIMNALTHLDFETIPYNFAMPQGSLTDGVGLRYGTMDISNDSGLFITNLNAVADTFFIGDPLHVSQGISLLPNVNVNIYSTSGITVSQGDSPVSLSILYREILIP